MTDPDDVKKMIEQVGGEVKEMHLFEDHGFATATFPLRKDHWVYGSSQRPPMPFRTGYDDPRRERFNEMVTEAARYAIKASTMNGEDWDFDPDAMVQNFVVGMLGYHTPNALSEDDWANPDPPPPPWTNS